MVFILPLEKWGSEGYPSPWQSSERSPDLYQYCRTFYHDFLIQVLIFQPALQSLKIYLFLLCTHFALETPVLGCLTIAGEGSRQGAVEICWEGERVRNSILHWISCSGATWLIIVGMRWNELNCWNRNFINCSSWGFCPPFIAFRHWL